MYLQNENGGIRDEDKGTDVKKGPKERWKEGGGKKGERVNWQNVFFFYYNGTLYFWLYEMPFGVCKNWDSIILFPFTLEK